MYRFIGLILLASGCQFNPKLDSGWGSYGRKTCVFLGEKLECDTLSTAFMVPGAITIIVLPAMFIYLLSKKSPSDDTALYKSPLGTFLALLGLFCAGLSVAYDGPIDFDGPWMWVGIASLVIAVGTAMVTAPKA